MKGINTVMEKIDIHIHTRLPKYSGEGRFKYNEIERNDGLFK